MGSQQSSHADSETKDVPIQEQFHQKGSKESVKGRKSNFTANGVIGGDDKQAELVSSEEESEETDIEEETEEGKPQSMIRCLYQDWFAFLLTFGFCLVSRAHRNRRWIGRAS